MHCRAGSAGLDRKARPGFRSQDRKRLQGKAGQGLWRVEQEDGIHPLGLKKRWQGEEGEESGVETIIQMVGSFSPGKAKVTTESKI